MGPYPSTKRRTSIDTDNQITPTIYKVSKLRYILVVDEGELQSFQEVSIEKTRLLGIKSIQEEMNSL